MHVGDAGMSRRRDDDADGVVIGLNQASAPLSAPQVRVFEALHLVRAEHLWARLKGLLGTSYWPHDAVLLLRPCNCVHTAFMRYPIDIVFVDRQGVIVRIAPAVAPWRMKGAWRAHAVLELAAGRVRELRWRPGQRLPDSLCPWLRADAPQATKPRAPTHADAASCALEAPDSLYDGYAPTMPGSFVRTHPPASSRF